MIMGLFKTVKKLAKSSPQHAVANQVNATKKVNSSKILKTVGSLVMLGIMARKIKR